MKITSVFLLASLLWLGACSSKNRLDIDVSGVSAPFELVRFDSLLFSAKVNELDTKIPDWLSDHSDFMETYSTKVITIGASNTADYSTQLATFYNYIAANSIDREVQKTFQGYDLKGEFTEAFKHYKYYFPERKTPNVYTCVSGFAQSVFIDDVNIGVSLDKYLGASSALYARANINRYQREKMYKEKVVTDAMMSIAMSDYAFNDSVNNLLANMVYQGKLLYFVDAMLPETPDSVKIGYSAKGIRWVEHNEKDMWDYLIEKKLLFSDDVLEVRKFIGEGPFTVPFTNKSPAQVGIWIGWQVVRSYMEGNPEVTLKELMLNDDYANILRYSRYRP